MLIVHHLNHSRSLRILWLLEELGLPYEIKFYQRDSKTMRAPEALRQVHALGKAPVLTDGQQVIAESAVIIEYLLYRYDVESQLKPVVGGDDWLDYLYWLHYAESSLMPVLSIEFIFSLLTQSPTPFLVRPIGHLINQGIKRHYLTAEIRQHADFVEQHLSQSRWFAGQQFSAADIQMSFALEALVSSGLSQQQHYPAIEQHLANSHLRPAYQRAIAKGGPFGILK